MPKEALKDLLPKEIAKYLGGGVAGVLGTLLFAVWQEAGVPTLTTLEQAASKALLLRISLLLLLLNLLSRLIFWLLRNRPELPLTQRFSFDSYGGFYIDPKTGESVCPRCLSEGKIVHMMNVGGPRMCNACQTTCRGKNLKADSK